MSTLQSWAAGQGVYRKWEQSVLTLASKRARKLCAVASTQSQPKCAQAIVALNAVRELEQAIEALQKVFTKRWTGRSANPNHPGVGSNTVLQASHTTLVSRHNRSSTTWSAATPAAAAAALRKAAAAVNTQHVPWTNGSRSRKFARERTNYGHLVAAARAHQSTLNVEAEGLFAEAASMTIANAPGAVAAIPGDAAASRKVRATLPLPPGVKDELSNDLRTIVPGFAPLVLQAGWAVDDGPHLAPSGALGWRAASSGGAHAAASPIMLPLLVDLGSEGGLATDDAATVNSMILRALALLPTGQLKLEVFDPVQLGQSVKYLFALGATGASIYGRKIWTSADDLRQLLNNVEAHIAFVTQKYLGAAHSSLFEYNQAAGQVAEPFRLLVLFDYPYGFTRANGMDDDDLLAQLRKITAAGPRCGVYTLVVTSHQMGVDNLPYLSAGHHQPFSGRAPRHLTSLPSTMAPPTQNLNELATAVRARGADALVSLRTSWSWRPAPGLDTSTGAVKDLMVTLEKALIAAGNVQVSATSVGALAQRLRQDHVRKGLPSGPPVALPDDDSTWWKASSATGLHARVGRSGSTDVAVVSIDSTVAHAHVLVGGKPGSGKSVFLHGLIGDLVRTYHPAELELFLADIKMGVEFQAYTTLPHARVVALESGRDFGLSILQALDQKMVRRGALFRAAGAQDIEEYRRRVPGKPMPRVVAVLDEFHGLFEVDDAQGDVAARHLRKVIKLGRALGVHLVLASQTISGAPALPKDAIGLIPTRVVFSSSDADSRLLLADDNTAATLLSRAGEGIINRQNGRKGANERFQALYTNRGEAESLTTRLHRMAWGKGIKLRPAVVDGIRECPITPDVVQALRSPSTADTVGVPIGQPMSLASFVRADLGRHGGANLLAIAPATRLTPLLTLATATALDLRTQVAICDFGGMNSDLSIAVEPAVMRQATASGGKNPIRSYRGRETASVLAALAKLVDSRHQQQDYTARPLLLLLANLERATELTPGTPLADTLETILKDGSSVGVHVVAAAQQWSTVERRLGYSALDHFSIRVAGTMSREDSNRVVDSPVASDIDPEQLVHFDHATNTSEVTRAFAMPGTEIWKVLYG